MSTVSEQNVRWPGQHKPTTEEARPFLELLASAEAYPRRSRFGGRLRKVV